MSKIVFFSFNGVLYTTAREVEDYAAKFGASVRIDPDGTRHPGSVCNRVLKVIQSNTSFRRLFGLASFDYIQIDIHRHPEVEKALKYADYVYYDQASVKYGMLDLYSVRAASTICAFLLNNHAFTINENDIETIVLDSKLDYVPKKLEVRRKQVANSLLGLSSKVETVISSLTEEEQTAVRKYNSLVRESREQGRPCVRRRRS